MDTLYKKTIVRAKIKGKIVIIDLASKDRNAYSDIKRRIKYLGKGTYYSYNDVQSKDKELTHFWEFA